jgi:uncharacterized protein with HEPN domain
MPPPDDDTRLRHLIEAAEKATAYAAERDRAALDDDEVLRLALTKLVEIVGEAAKQVSEKTRLAHPEVPCPQPPGCVTVSSTTTSTSISTSSGRP